MVTKFKIVLPDSNIEFATEIEAQAYKDAHNLSEEIETFEDVVVSDSVAMPDISAKQLRQAIVLSGLTEAYVHGVLEALPEPTRSLALIEWEYETKFSRNNPLLNDMAPMIGFTNQDLDNIWLLAATL
jgi:dGTP triphosphohydrolase